MISIRIYGDEGVSPGMTFRQLVRIVSAWPQIAGPWESFCARDGNIMDRISVISSPISLTDIEELGRTYDGPARRLSAEIAFRCWSFGDGPPKEDKMLLTINAWGPRYGDSGDCRFNDSKLDGCAEIMIGNAGIYYAALGPDATHPDVREINFRVKNNIDNFLQLVVLLIDGIKPRALKVFNGEGLRLPFNAHYAYYQDFSGVIRDLTYLAKAWETGLSCYPADPPLKDFNPEQHSFYLHLSRSEAERQILYERFVNLLPFASLVTEEIVQQVLTEPSTSFSALAIDNGIAVLRYPFFMNCFIDNLLLALLCAVNVENK